MERYFCANAGKSEHPYLFGLPCCKRMDWLEMKHKYGDPCINADQDVRSLLETKRIEPAFNSNIIGGAPFDVTMKIGLEPKRNEYFKSGKCL